MLLVRDAVARTEYFDIIFKCGMADGWTFGVPMAFRNQLDIVYATLVHRKASRKLRERPWNEDDPLPTIYRLAWTRGGRPC